MKRSKRSAWRQFHAIQSRTPQYRVSQKTESDLKAALFAYAFTMVKNPINVSSVKVEVLSDTPSIPVS